MFVTSLQAANESPQCCFKRRHDKEGAHHHDERSSK